MWWLVSYIHICDKRYIPARKVSVDSCIFEKLLHVCHFWSVKTFYYLFVYRVVQWLLLLQSFNTTLSVQEQDGRVVGYWIIWGVVHGWMMISVWPVTVEKEPGATKPKSTVTEVSPEKIVFPPNVIVPLPNWNFYRCHHYQKVHHYYQRL